MECHLYWKLLASKIGPVFFGPPCINDDEDKWNTIEPDILLIYYWELQPPVWWFKLTNNKLKGDWKYKTDITYLSKLNKHYLQWLKFSILKILYITQVQFSCGQISYLMSGKIQFRPDSKKMESGRYITTICIQHTWSQPDGHKRIILVDPTILLQTILV